MFQGDPTRQPLPSVTLELAARCEALRESGRDIVDLGAGEPDFRTPDFAAQAGIAAIVQGFTHYTPPAGVPALRHCIAEHLSARSNKSIDPGQIVVTSGAKQALFNCMHALFGPGDDVLLPAPYWSSYPPLIGLAGAHPVPVHADPANGLRIDVAALATGATERTRGVVINSPANPTGVTHSLEELHTIASWAAERRIWIVADEIYGRICFDADRAPSFLDLPAELLDRVVLIDGASKAFAMTGWRLGYSWSGEEVATRMATLQSHVTSNASTPAQYAGIAVFRDEPRVHHAVRAMVSVLRHRRDKAMAMIRRELPHVPFVEPAGAFYLFLDVAACYAPGRSGSAEFCSWLLETAGVALVPGIAFGNDDHVRLSFAAPQTEINEGIRRITAALAQPAAVPLPVQ